MHLKICFVSNRAILPSAPSGRKGWILLKNSQNVLQQKIVQMKF